MIPAHYIVGPSDDRLQLRDSVREVAMLIFAKHKAEGLKRPSPDYVISCIDTLGQMSQWDMLLAVGTCQSPEPGR